MKNQQEWRKSNEIQILEAKQKLKKNNKSSLHSLHSGNKQARSKYTKRIKQNLSCGSASSSPPVRDPAQTFLATLSADRGDFRVLGTCIQSPIQHPLIEIFLLHRFASLHLLYLHRRDDFIVADALPTSHRGPAIGIGFVLDRLQ